MMDGTSCIVLDWIGAGMMLIAGYLALVLLLLAVLALGRYVFFSPGRPTSTASHARHE